MKKSAKSASKKGKKNAPAKKMPAKTLAKKSAKKVVSKKAIPVKKIKAKTISKKAVGKKITKKAPPSANKKSKNQQMLEKKNKAKIAIKKKIFDEKEKKKALLEKAALKKKIELQKKAEKIAKEKEKLLAKKTKEAEKKALKLAKEAAKLAAKPPKKLTKKEEKELLKLKGKKGDEFFSEEGEGTEGKKRYEDDEENDDFEAEAGHKKVKMTFDEDLEEEIIPIRKKNKSGIPEDIKDSLVEEILALSEDFSIKEVFTSIRNMDLFKIESDECVVRGCDNPSTTSGYCRYHYIKLWKDIKKKELILSEGRLAGIIEELTRKYPMKYIEAILQDLSDDKSFNHVLKDLDIETDEADGEGFDDDEVLDDDQDIAFETKVVKPSFDD